MVFVETPLYQCIIHATILPPFDCEYSLRDKLRPTCNVCIIQMSLSLFSGSQGHLRNIPLTRSSSVCRLVYEISPGSCVTSDFT